MEPRELLNSASCTKVFLASSTGITPLTRVKVVASERSDITGGMHLSKGKVKS